MTTRRGCGRGMTNRTGNREDTILENHCSRVAGIEENRVIDTNSDDAPLVYVRESCRLTYDDLWL